MTLKVAEKNLNPGNVKQSPNNPWYGSVGADGHGHTIFEETVYGCRALVKTLQAKYLNDKISLSSIIADYAPADDTQGSIPGGEPNDPMEYAVTVSKWTGYDIYQDLRLFSKDGKVGSYDRLLAICRGIERFEAGKLWVLEEDWLEGIALYLKDFVTNHPKPQQV